TAVGMLANNVQLIYGNGARTTGFCYAKNQNFSNINFDNNDLNDIAAKSNFGGFSYGTYTDEDNNTTSIDPIGFIRCRDSNKYFPLNDPTFDRNDLASNPPNFIDPPSFD